MEKLNFDNIRSYRDDEVNDKLRKLVKDKEFIYILRKIFTDERIANLSEELNEVNSVYDFQSKYISYYVKSLLDLSISELSISGIEKLKKNKSYLFISNHRDIIIDSALINEILLSNGFSTSENAIGNNLLIYKWIETLVRLNKSFIVRRDLVGREMLQASIKLSAYIRDAITNRNTSVWIAQREGRTKDGNDVTEEALLKMLNLSGTNNFEKDFSELNIIPISISYETEPTIESKIASTYSNIKGLNNEKTVDDDLTDMGRGLYSAKGKVTVVFGDEINNNIKKLDKIANRNEKIKLLSKIIDNSIYSNFKLTKNNYIAFDILTNSKKCLKENKYQKADETKLRFQCQKTISTIEGEKELLENIFYRIYANPLINKIQIP